MINEVRIAFGLTILGMLLFPATTRVAAGPGMDSWTPDERNLHVEMLHPTYLTFIELVDYLNAFRSLKVSADKTTFLNNSSTEVWIRITDYSNLDNPPVQVLCIPGGESARWKSLNPES